MHDEDASHLVTINELLAANESLRMERDAMKQECASLRETVRGQVEADLLLASFRIISDLVLKHEPLPQDKQTQVEGVQMLNAMRSDPNLRPAPPAPTWPQGPTNLPNPYERRSNTNGTHTHPNR